MPSSCYLCSLKKKRNVPPVRRSKVYFHKFPANPEIRKAWFMVCGLCEETDDVSKCKICSEHFSDADYVEPRAATFGGRMVLKPSAVPSISVPFPICTPQSTVIERKFEEVFVVESVPIEVDSVTSTSKSELSTDQQISDEEILPHTTIEPEQCTPKKRKFHEPRYISEITTPDVATPQKARRVLTLVRQSDRKKSQQIKALQDKTRHLTKKIASLKELIAHLQKKGLMTEEASATLMVHL